VGNAAGNPVRQMSGSILIVDDDESMCRLLESGLAASGYQTTSRSSADTAVELLREHEFDTVITDLRMRGCNGLELCARISENRPDIPVIVITAFGTMETAIDAIRAGAYDFVVKPFELEAIRHTVQRAVQHRALSKQVELLQQQLREPTTGDTLIGESAPMRRLRDMINRVAPADSTVLLTGESGTGKELVARSLHRSSARRDGPFVAINCAAMPEALLESELFGHARGAYTDARDERQGLFLQANRGTLFLDEIGELSAGLQPKILRAIQERVVRPVGAKAEVPFDARIVAASNRDLESAVAVGTFRADLYYRIHVIRIELPPLRARGRDVLLLATHFLEHYARTAGKGVSGMVPAAVEKLLAYSWPGNVRELQNCMERAVTLSRYSEICPDDLPETIREFRRGSFVLPTDDPSELLPIEEVERRYVLRVLEATANNKSMAARVLGLSRKTLYRKLRQYGVLSDDSSGGSDEPR